jgi:hypothetical protein
MRRRNFTKAIASSAIAWPLAARAQQPDMVRRIGVLMGPAESDPDAQVDIAAFRQGTPDVTEAAEGAKPVNFRVQAPTKFQSVINLKTAKALGLDVPVHLQQLANEIIE